jgi:hypothetical protein
MAKVNSTQCLIKDAIFKVNLISEKMKIVSDNLSDVKNIIDEISNPKSNL